MVSLEPLAKPLVSQIDVIGYCRLHSLPASIVGRWVWCQFDTKPDKTTRELLKAAGFRWCKNRGEWAHNCGYACRRGTGHPRAKYGALPVAALSDRDMAEIQGAH